MCRMESPSHVQDSGASGRIPFPLGLHVTGLVSQCSHIFLCQRKNHMPCQNPKSDKLLGDLISEGILRKNGKSAYEYVLGWMRTCSAFILQGCQTSRKSDTQMHNHVLHEKAYTFKLCTVNAMNASTFMLYHPFLISSTAFGPGTVLYTR